MLRLLSSPKAALAVNVLLTLVTLLALGHFIEQGLASTGFWYDESVQYWISRGIDAFGPPLQPPGGLTEVMKENGRANLDPGGFSVLLYYWMMVARDPVWLRAFPLIFFCLGVVSLGCLGWRWRKSYRFALFSALTPAAFPLVLDYANEVRAYSMEFTGVIVACLLLDLMLEKPSQLRSLIGGLLIGLFLTSRYSSVFVAAAVAGVYLWHLARLQTPLASRLGTALLFLLPLGISGLAVVSLGFVPQYHARIAYDGGNMIGYLSPYKVSGMPFFETMKLLGGNLLSPAALPLFVMPLIALILLRKKSGTMEGSRLRARSCYFTALVAVMLTAVLWKWHPWAIHTKWSLYLQALSAVLVVRVTADLMEVVSSRDAGVRLRPGQELWVLAGMTIILSLCAALHRREIPFDLSPTLSYFDRHKPKRNTVSVDPYCYPTLRYFYDEGPFAGRAFYPRGFRLPFWNSPQPLINDKTRYLISGQNPRQRAAAYPGVKFFTDPALPNHVVRVELAQPAEAAVPEPLVD